ncbi:hypothetical protein ACIP4S_32820 [Streptomyces chartreusis]|uniref:hypothetical protein n=1 Tax=Streptomyces chartreusis TaxID=1969 RepID=UPI00381765DF
MKSTSSFGSYASGWMPSSWVEYSPNRLMCSVRYGEMCARSSGSTPSPPPAAAGRSFPEQEADRIRGEPAAAIEAWLGELRAETAHLDHRVHHSTDRTARSEALRHRSELRQEIARLLDQLADLAEDTAAEEHRAAADRCRAEAATDSEFAALLVSQDAVGRS